MKHRRWQDVPRKVGYAWLKKRFPKDGLNGWYDHSEAVDAFMAGVRWAFETHLPALAAAARQGRDVKQARGEAPQSGPKGNAQ